MLITQLEAGPVLSAAAFWARERSITQKRPRCLRLPHRRVPGLPPKSQEDLQIQTVTPSAAFPPWSPCGKEGTAPASVTLTRGLLATDSRRLSHPPSLPGRRGFGKLDLFTALLLTACFPVELYSISGKGGNRG